MTELEPILPLERRFVRAPGLCVEGQVARWIWIRFAVPGVYRQELAREVVALVQGCCAEVTASGTPPLCGGGAGANPAGAPGGYGEGAAPGRRSGA